MKRFIYGYFNRKTDCFEHFAIFDDLGQLIDYEKALYQCSKSKKCSDFDFSCYTLFPEDYSIYCLGTINYAPRSPLDWFKAHYQNCGDFSDLLNIKKESDEDVERYSDDYDSEPVYSSKSPRA